MNPEEQKKLDKFHRFLLRHSLYGINPTPPNLEKLKELGAFDKEDNKESN